MVLMVFGSVIISFTGLIILGIEGAEALQVNFYRGLVLSVTIFGVMLWRFRQKAPQKILEVGKPGLMAGCFLAAAGLCLLQAITTTTVAATLFICNSIPFLTAALAWVILKETPSKSTIATMVVAAFGVGVMIMAGLRAGSFYGNIMALLTAGCFSAFAIVVRRNRNIEMLPALLISGLIISLVSLILLSGKLSISLPDLLLCILLGSFISAVPNALFITASRHLIAAELTLFMLLEFALGPIWVWLFINEVPAHATLIGGGLVIISVLLRVWFEMRQSRTL